jgi:hypothetical protein
LWIERAPPCCCHLSHTSQAATLDYLSCAEVFSFHHQFGIVIETEAEFQAVFTRGASRVER